MLIRGRCADRGELGKLRRAGAGGHAASLQLACGRAGRAVKTHACRPSRLGDGWCRFLTVSDGRGNGLALSFYSGIISWVGTLAAPPPQSGSSSSKTSAGQRQHDAPWPPAGMLFRAWGDGKPGGGGGGAEAESKQLVVAHIAAAGWIIPELGELLGGRVR